MQLQASKADDGRVRIDVIDSGREMAQRLKDLLLVEPSPDGRPEVRHFVAIGRLLCSNAIDNFLYLLQASTSAETAMERIRSGLATCSGVIPLALAQSQAQELGAQLLVEPGQLSGIKVSLLLPLLLPRSARPL